MANIPNLREVEKLHLYASEQMDAHKMLQNKTMLRVIEVLKNQAPRSHVDPASAHATIASFSYRDGYVAALTALENINHQRTAEAAIMANSPRNPDPIFNPKD